LQENDKKRFATDMEAWQKSKKASTTTNEAGKAGPVVKERTVPGATTVGGDFETVIELSE